MEWQIPFPDKKERVRNFTPNWNLPRKE